MFDFTFLFCYILYQEYATEESQQYKEGQVILERALVTESEGIEEIGEWIFKRLPRIFCKIPKNIHKNVL